MDFHCLYCDASFCVPLDSNWYLQVKKISFLLKPKIEKKSFISVSSTVNAEGIQTMTLEEIETRTQGIRVLYYVIYSCILAFAFGIIPFAYFYYEEDDEQVTFRQVIIFISI